MGILSPVFACINCIIGCFIYTIVYFEAFIAAAIISKYAPYALPLRSPGSDVANTECPPPSTPAKEMKRIKLLLDIMISPGGSRVVNVSSKNVMDVSPPSMFERFISQVAHRMLTVTHMVKQILLWLQHTLTGAPVIQPSKSPSTNGCRKTKSPRRRISPYKRFFAVPFRMLGLAGNPQHDEWNISLPQSYEPEAVNATRTQSVEKRKRSEDEDSSASSSDEAGTVRTKTPCAEISEDEVDVDTPTESEGLDEFSEATYQPSPSLTQRLIDIEEEYESAEDPDYEIPKDYVENEISSSSSESVSDAEHELTDLHADYREHYQKNTGVPENGVSVNGDQDHHNGEEYTNGQASIRELVNRNPQLRPVIRNASEYSSPFSNLPSDPSTPNTPRSFRDDSSHLETP